MGYRRWLRLRTRRADAERELTEEIESHLAMRAEALERNGETEERARAQALERFGDRRAVLAVARTRDRRLRRWESMDRMRQDLRLAWRRARTSPGATLLTLLIFALGIGLTTTMFTFVDRVLLRPLPYTEPERLVVLQGETAAGDPVEQVSYSNWADWEEQNGTLTATAVHRSRSYAIHNDVRAYEVSGQLVTDDFFDVLRTRMVRGRGFTAVDAGQAVVVVSESLWRRELGGRLVGELDMVLDGERLQVIGVVRDGEEYPAQSEVWRLLAVQRRLGGATRNNIGW